MATKKLHVGCGRNVLAGWVNLDCVPLPGVDLVFNLEGCGETLLPLGDDSIDEFLLSHVLEHVGKTLPLMQELHRVAIAGATALVRLPYGSSDDAWEDPTHVRAYFPNSFGYFSQPYYWRADYGYRGDWLTEKVYLVVSKAAYGGADVATIAADVHQKRNIVREMVVEMRALKPIRQPIRELQVAPKLEFLLA